MEINNSQSSKTRTNFGKTQHYLASQNQSSQMPLSQNTSQKSSLHIENPYRNKKIIISIMIVILTTMWVRATMQSHAPFVRAAQCYFNEMILQHKSQDIYQGSDVVYWKTAQYNKLSEILGVFTRLDQTINGLHENSLFQIRSERREDQMLLQATYGNSKLKMVDQFKNYKGSISQLHKIFQETVFRRVFYEHLWKLYFQINIPIKYRGESKTLFLKLQSEVFGNFMMSFYLNIDIIDDVGNLLSDDQTFNQGNLGIRKRPSKHSMFVSFTYTYWLILVLYILLFSYQYKFIAYRNQQVNKNLRVNIIQQKKIQKLMNQFNMQEKGNLQLVINDSEGSKEDQNIDFNDPFFKIPEKYNISIIKRLQKIGPYYIVQSIISFTALISFYHANSGIICFLSWTKLMIYFSQTKNRYMIGFLLQEALPFYLKILFNIFLLMTAFVLFNMLVLQGTIKFQTLKLGYFEYIFNYFQYGIYENFIKAFQKHGLFAQFFYFLQLMIMLYIGNNILMSVLASEITKHSYLEVVQQMLEKIQTQCPACGADPKDQKKDNSQVYSQLFLKKQPQLVSKFLQDNNLTNRYSGSDKHANIKSPKDNFNIKVNSPKLSPFFPLKNQKKQSEIFLSPHLKGGQFEQKMKHLNKKIKQQKIKDINKIQQINKLTNKIQKSKKMQVEIVQSNIQQIEIENKYYRNIRSKMLVLQQKIKKIQKINKNNDKNNKQRLIINKIKQQILQSILNKSKQLYKQIQQRQQRQQ